jgi:hypothetical protein
MPLPELKDADTIFFSTITAAKTHTDYKRVCEIACDYTAYTTGVGIEEKLFQFNMRETEEMFMQRCRLTKSVTPDIANSIMNPMFKIGRTPAAISYAWGANMTEDATKKKTLVDVAARFNGTESLDSYLQYRLAELDATDPNSFVVVEFEGQADATQPTKNTVAPYPLEVNSMEAVDYAFDNNILQYLTVLVPITMMDKDGNPLPGNKYSQYLKNNSIVATQIHFSVVDDYLTKNPETIPYKAGTVLQETVNNKSFIYLFSFGGADNATPVAAGSASDKEDQAKKTYYIVQVFRHGIPFVPAKRVGIRRDLTTRGRTCVPIMHPAQCYFEKSIKQCSEFDLTNALHTFPQKIQYSDPCPGFEESEGNHMPCNGGQVLGGGRCRACHGTGWKVHTSSQDMIQIRLPKDPKDMISLENIIAYKSPPIDLLKFQQDYGNELREKAIQATYNSDLFRPNQTHVTATEKMIDLDSVYDTLQAFAKNYSNCWRLIIQSIAFLKDIGADFNPVHQFPVDFKMKSFSALLDDMASATANNAPSHIKKAITQDLTRRMYLDYPEEIVKIETKDKFFPFPGKMSAEITFIISSDLTPTRNKVLYANFDQIFAELEEENEEFYSLAKDAQKKLIDTKVAALITELETETFNNTNIPFVPGGGAPAPAAGGTGTLPAA